MDFYARALELRQQTVEHRRWFHRTAEVGVQMPQTTDYLLQALTELGLRPRMCGHGVIADVGQGRKRLLLRSDLDALPMTEESGLDFACTAGRAHGCGHDCHAAMLLTAAKLLKEREQELQGTVRLMFQPGEETLEGCLNMLAHGVLEPLPDAALALHLMAGRKTPGTFLYQSGPAATLFSVENVTITVEGKGSHGAYPDLGVDPIAIGAQILLALQSLVAREIDPKKACVITVGQFQAGETGNVIPQKAVLRGSVRADAPEVRAQLHRRIEEVCTSIAAAFSGDGPGAVGGACIPPLICDGAVSEAMASYIKELSIPGLQVASGIRGNASEDFACLAAMVPSAYFFLSAGYDDERGDAVAHHPKVLFHEDALAMGAAALAQCALRWLQDFEPID